MCTDVFDDACECPHCMEGDTEIDCTCVPDTLFNQFGETIVGDLKEFGWVVMRDLRPFLTVNKITHIILLLMFL